MPTVEVPIIDLLLNPSVGQLQETDEGVHGPGPVSVDLAIPNALGSVAYGVRVSAITVPLQWGKTLGNPDIFVPPIGQWALECTLGDLNSVLTQVTPITFDGQLMFWQQQGLMTLHLYVAPGVTLHQRWLTVLV